MALNIDDLRKAFDPMRAVRKRTFIKVDLEKVVSGVTSAADGLFEGEGDAEAILEALDERVSKIADFLNKAHYDAELDEIIVEGVEGDDLLAEFEKSTAAPVAEVETETEETETSETQTEGDADAESETSQVEISTEESTESATESTESGEQTEQTEKGDSWPTDLAPSIPPTGLARLNKREAPHAGRRKEAWEKARQRAFGSESRTLS